MKNGAWYINFEASFIIADKRLSSAPLSHLELSSLPSKAPQTKNALAHTKFSLRESHTWYFPLSPLIPNFAPGCCVLTNLMRLAHKNCLHSVELISWSGREKTQLAYFYSSEGIFAAGWAREWIIIAIFHVSLHTIEQLWICTSKVSSVHGIAAKATLSMDIKSNSAGIIASYVVFSFVPHCFFSGYR